MSQWRNYGEQFSYGPPVKYKGLYTQGATCYLNSVLQVLFMTEDFREAVERYHGSDCIDVQLKSLFEKLKKDTTDTFEITKTLDITRVCEQRDAAEYFEKILNLTSNESSQIFSGKQAHRTVCSACNTQRDTDGKFWHLPLTLVDSGDYSVVNGIKEYFKVSTFSGGNQMYCEKCDAKCDATFNCVIKHHPKVLVLLLKRFELDYYSMTYFKINHKVLIPYTLQIPENQTYELYAVVDHVGDLRHGHYSACIKSQEEERWFQFDDARVTQIDFQPFQSDNFESSNSAYLLFYRKKSEDTREVSAPGGCEKSTSTVEAEVVNGGEYEDEGKEEVGKSIKIEVKRRQEGGEDPESYRVEKKVEGNSKTAFEVNSGAGKVERKKFLTKLDLLYNTTHDGAKVGSYMQNMAKDDEVVKQGSSSWFESHEQHRVAVQKREVTHLQEERVLIKPERDTNKRSSDDQVSVTRSVQKPEDVESDSDSSSSSTQTKPAEAQEEVRQTQERAESDAKVEENQSSNMLGICIVRIYEEEERITPTVTERKTEKIDIKLTTLKELLSNRGNTFGESVKKVDVSVHASFQVLPFREGKNRRIILDVPTLLIYFSQRNMVEIRCQSPAPQSYVTIRETSIQKGSDF